jgi:membrane protein YqaA with SNARE-associated domain
MEYKHHALKTSVVGLSGAADILIPGPVETILAGALAPKGKKVRASTLATADSTIGSVPGYTALAIASKAPLKK